MTFPASLAAFAASDALRLLALVEGALVFGVALGETFLYLSRYRDPEDPWTGRTRLIYMALVRLGVAAFAMLAVTIVSTKLGDGHLTFRTPMALLAFTLCLLGMYGILADDEELRDDAAGYRHNRRRRETDRIG